MKKREIFLNIIAGLQLEFDWQVLVSISQSVALTYNYQMHANADFTC